MKKQSETHKFVVGPDHAGDRLDKVIAANIEDLSRARVQALIDDGAVHVSFLLAKNASTKVKEGDRITIDVPPPVDAEPQPEDIPLDVIYEDDDLLVINKQAGLVVHPGAGNWSGTLVNALLHHCQDSLSGIGGVSRPGIVHRLDKDTSGLMVVAKHDKAHNGLAEQLKDRSLSRVYHALVLGVPTLMKGTIDQPLTRDPSNRLRMAIRRGGKEAVTHYRVEQSWGTALALVECALESGRTHQIRVHMQSLKHPLIGDPVYGPQPTAVRSKMKKAGFEENVIDLFVNFPRQMLHARKIAFMHPVSGEALSFEVDVPDDLSSALKMLDNI